MGTCVDRKAPLWFDNYEAIEGNDIAGYVERLGEGVTRFQVGDKVGSSTGSIGLPGTDN